MAVLCIVLARRSYRVKLARRSKCWHSTASLLGRRSAHSSADEKPLLPSTPLIACSPDAKHTFKSPISAHEVEKYDGLPPMSLHGGCEAEFQEYWRRNSFCRHLVGGWVEYHAHPQVNMEPYWYNLKTGEMSWSEPSAEELYSDNAFSGDGLCELTGTGPVWDMSIQELKEALYSRQADRLGLQVQDLARRAVAEYERFSPRVLSWHDFQYITFWFFGGMQKAQRASRGSLASRKSFFHGSAGPDLFADPAFFHAAADIIIERMHRMHPINLTYFVWTFSRAEVVIPNLMNAVGDHLCKGRLPMMDRCSLGTMVWNFGRQGVRHDQFFEDSATELSRANRARSLAPRNVQNTMIAYSRRRHWNERLMVAMAFSMQRLLDGHDPPGPKLDRSVLFSYRCIDGSEVLADSWRISGLTIILRGFRILAANGLIIEASVKSMVDYVQRSVRSSPVIMREPGDACNFMLELARLAEEMPSSVMSHHLRAMGKDASLLCNGASKRQRAQLREALEKFGVIVHV